MLVEHARIRAVDARPAAQPGPKAEIEIFDIRWLVHFVESAQRFELRGIVQAASTAPIENVAVIFTLQRNVASYWELGHSRCRIHHRLAGFLPAAAFGEEDLRRGAEKVRDRLERPPQCLKEARLHLHVIIEHAHMRKPRATDAAIHRCCERERLRAMLD